MIVLAIGAHPDDVELGIGGTIRKHIENGDTVHVLILSRGERGVPDDRLTRGERALDDTAKNNLKGKKREAETRTALHALGVRGRNITVIGCPDTGISCNPPTIREVEAVVTNVNPDIVYTHYYEEEHLDHLNTSLCTLHTARGAGTILLYESPSTKTYFAPSYFEDISNQIDKKLEALAMHQTQAGKLYMDEEVVRAKARFRAFQGRFKGYAEAFVSYRIRG